MDPDRYVRILCAKARKYTVEKLCFVTISLTQSFYVWALLSQTTKLICITVRNNAVFNPCFQSFALINHTLNIDSLIIISTLMYVLKSQK